MPSWQSKLFNFLIYLIFKKFPFLMNKKEVKFYRHAFRKLTSYLKVPSLMISKPFKINHVSAEWLYFSENLNKPIIFYLHGGAYLIGSIDTHRSLMAKIAEPIGACVFAINYRLAPEYPFPAALEDTLLSYEWLLNNNISPEDIIIAGDSAGGGLAIATLIALRDKKLPLPSAAICLSPWMDLSLSGASLQLNAKKDPLLTVEKMSEAACLYLNGIDAKTPLASPHYGKLEGLPPLYIQASKSELLFSDSISLAKKAKEADVPVTLEIWKQMIHGWQLFNDWIPEGKIAISHIHAFIREHYKKKN
jgi:monoterpene epsilon-lactone hydrolase